MACEGTITTSYCIGAFGFCTMIKKSLVFLLGVVCDLSMLKRVVLKGNTFSTTKVIFSFKKGKIPLSPAKITTFLAKSNMNILTHFQPKNPKNELFE